MNIIKCPTCKYKPLLLKNHYINKRMFYLLKEVYVKD